MKLEYLIILFLSILMIIILTDGKKELFTNFGYANIHDLYEEPYILNDVISEEEAYYILEKTSSNLEDILVGEEETDTNISKSKTTWLYKDNPIIYNIIARISNMLHINLENTEDGLQIIKYKPNGYYKNHHASCCEDENKCADFIKERGHRIKTVLIYLNDDFTEGETYFPLLNKKIKPPKYGAVVFNTLSNYGNRCHPKALHTALPIKNGIKYIANLWFRESKKE